MRTFIDRKTLFACVCGGVCAGELEKLQRDCCGLQEECDGLRSEKGSLQSTRSRLESELDRWGLVTLSRPRPASASSWGWEGRQAGRGREGRQGEGGQAGREGGGGKRVGVGGARLVEGGRGNG